MSERNMPQDAEAVREVVREGYTRVARSGGGCCGDAKVDHTASLGLGYAAEELEAIPDGADLGLGCGNPTAIDSLKPGEVVVDLGSGGGIDVFLAARQVGPTGRAIGVDMTDAMLERARENARKGGYDNVEFKKGTIEALPLEDSSVDVVISNCVVNLSPEKDKVFAEAFRVLRPGGRLMVSDIVLERHLPEIILKEVEAYLGCVSGAALKNEYLGLIAGAGFEDVRVQKETSVAHMITEDNPLVQEASARFGLGIDEIRNLASAAKSIHVFARK